MTLDTEELDRSFVYTINEIHGLSLICFDTPGPSPNAPNFTLYSIVWCIYARLHVLYMLLYPISNLMHLSYI